MNNYTRTILKKLMRDTLNKEEESALIYLPKVSEQMYRQWDSEDIAKLPASDMNRIWAHIQRYMKGKPVNSVSVFYKIYSLAASILLILGMAGGVYLLQNDTPPLMYVASSGIRNIASVSLPDGTEVQMGPGSRLTYPEYFDGKTREVTLEGQAFFDVSKDVRKPFTVHTSHLDVTAVGTAFEVFSYEGENRHEAILLNGKVKIGLQQEGGSGKADVILTPDEMFVYDKWQQSVEVKAVDASRYSAWRRNGILSFENEKLSMIIPRLEQWYGRKIICQKDVAEGYRFTFKVRDESLERILFMLSRSSAVRYEEMNGDYKLYIAK